MTLLENQAVYQPEFSTETLPGDYSLISTRGLWLKQNQCPQNTVSTGHCVRKKRGRGKGIYVSYFLTGTKNACLTFDYDGMKACNLLPSPTPAYFSKKNTADLLSLASEVVALFLGPSLNSWFIYQSRMCRHPHVIRMGDNLQLLNRLKLSLNFNHHYQLTLIDFP